jgi:hypothetical protein
VPAVLLGATAVIAALLASAGPAHAEAGAAVQPSRSPVDMVRMSDEKTLTRWARPHETALVYSRPTSAARTVGRLRWQTEDRLPETYLVLALWRDSQGRVWSKVRLPKRPNGITGWVLREHLGRYRRVTTFLDLDKRKRRLTLYRSGERIWSAQVGIGAPGTETPSGRFYIREKFWVAGAPVYGPRALGTSAYAPNLTEWPGGGVVGIHGTNAPGLIPGKVSHGCIRVRNSAVKRLYTLTPVGTPLWVH